MAGVVMASGEALGFLRQPNLRAKNKQESNREKHEEGKARKDRDRGGEKGDKNRPVPRKRPFGEKGPWPPRIPGLPILICPLCPFVFDPAPPSC